MSCCGNKKDVAPSSNPVIKQTPSNLIINKKVFDVNDQSSSHPITGFKPIPPNNVGNYKKITKDEHYWEQNTKGSKSRLFTDESALKFDLDHETGVANTFDIPTFDYQTLLNHNIHFNLNSKSHLNVDDGNRSTFKQSSGPVKVTPK